MYRYEVDYAKGGDKNLTLTMLAGGAPIPPSALLTLSPNQLAPIQVEQVESLNVSAVGPDGVALPKGVLARVRSNPSACDR